MGSIVLTEGPIFDQLGIVEADATALEQQTVTSALLWAERAVIRYLRYDPVRRTRTEYYPQMDLRMNGNTNAIWEASNEQAYLRSAGRTDELQLKHLPLRSITSLHVDYDGRFSKRSGSFSEDTLKTEGDYYWGRYDQQDDAGVLICRDGILLSYGGWPATPGSIQIVYVAGYSQDEFTGNTVYVDAVPIYEAVVFEAARKAKQLLLLSKSGGSSGSGGGSGTGWSAGAVSSERLGDYSYTLSSTSGGNSSGGGGGNGGLYDGVVDIAAESMERLADYVNIGYALLG